MTRLSLIFAFDQRFLPGFAPLVASLGRHSPILAGCDRIVITPDEAVAEDPQVRRLAARVRLITDAEIAAFGAVKRSRIPTYLQGDILPKDSMMKWFAYDDYGYDAAMVLDTDMINTRCADNMLKFLDVADVVGCPLFPVELRRAHGDALPQPIARRNIREFVAGEGEWERKLNSGVLLFNRKLMSPQVRDEMIAIASETAAANEQVVVRNWIRHHRDVRLRLITPIFNFNANFLVTAEPEGPRGLFPKVRFLHYVGAKKPWSIAPAERTWVHDLWLEAEAAAEA